MKSSATPKQVLRSTHQRTAVLQAVESLHGTHPTAARLCDFIKTSAPPVGLATIYRTLDRLVERGDVIAIRTGASVRYDLNIEPHHHLVCTQCGEVVDIDSKTVTVPSSLIASFIHASGFDLTHAVLQISGICPLCRQLETSSLP